MERGSYLLPRMRYGDTVHQHPGLARARSGQHQGVGVLPVIGHYVPLGPVVQALHDVAPRLRRRLPGEFLPLIGQPPVDEIRPGQSEVVQRQTNRICDGLDPLSRVLGHDVDLERLLIVVDLQRFQVGPLEAIAARLQPDGHGRPEHGHSPVETYHLLVVEPEQGLLQEAVHVDGPVQQLAEIQAVSQLSYGGLNQEVRAADIVGQLGKEMLEHGFRGLAPGLRTSQDGAPVLEEGDLHDLVLPGAHPHVRGALRFLQSVGGNAPQAPLNEQGQCIPVSLVLQVLAGLPQVKGLCLPYCLVRGLLLHQPYQVFFYRGGPGETLPGRALHSTVHIGRQDSVLETRPMRASSVMAFRMPSLVRPVIPLSSSVVMPSSL